MLLSILIPTYNRQQYLIKNLQMLSSHIMNNALQEDVEIIVSNNCSPDNTSQEVAKFMEGRLKTKVTLFNQPENIGLEKNALLVLGKSRAEYVMYLGDDDYIAEEYLNGIVGKLKQSKDIYCVLPAYGKIDYSGNPLDGGRDKGLKTNIYSPGFKNCLENSYRGHQLSGLVLKRENLLDSYQKNDVSNIYPFIYFVAECCLNGKTWHFPEYPVLVTAALQKDKDWNYGRDGLLSDIFDNYRKLERINFVQRSKLEFKVLTVQSWRYEKYLSKGKRKYFEVFFHFIKIKNTSHLTRIAFPVYLMYNKVRKWLL